MTAIKASTSQVATPTYHVLTASGERIRVVQPQNSKNVRIIVGGSFLELDQAATADLVTALTFFSTTGTLA
jgi:hypothetical protein